MGKFAALAAAGFLAVVAGVMALAFAMMWLEPAPTAASSGALKAGSVPKNVEPWVTKAGKLCSGITAPLLAAQLHVESAFNAKAASPAGAVGIAQFLPATFKSWGHDDDHNGHASPFDVGDAVMAQGRFMCSLWKQSVAAVKSHKAEGNPVDLALYCYNGGSVVINGEGGHPRSAETRAYAPKIRAEEQQFEGQAGNDGGGNVPAGPMAKREIGFAHKALGRLYALGAGGYDGPTMGNKYDCSGLMMYVFYQASNGKIRLPHTATGQQKLTHEVSKADAQPGDMVFYSSSDRSYFHHVGLYIGNDQMIDAPDYGIPVGVHHLYTDKLIVFGRMQ